MSLKGNEVNCWVRNQKLHHVYPIWSLHADLLLVGMEYGALGQGLEEHTCKDGFRV